MKLTNTIVLVTGANRGLGRALVIASLEAGAQRVYAAARTPAKLEPFAGFAQERVVPLALDITDPSSLAAAAARASDITVLINNAGILQSPGVLASTPAQLAQEFATNVFGTLEATRAFVPALARAAERGPAAVVNILSIVSLTNMPGIGAYSASKAASHSITQALRSDLGKQKIAVHGAYPGSIDTDMIRDMQGTKSTPALVAKGVIEGVEQGLDDIFPDPMSSELHAMWRRDPKELERALAGMSA